MILSCHHDIATFGHGTSSNRQECAGPRGARELLTITAAWQLQSFIVRSDCTLYWCVSQHLHRKINYDDLIKTVDWTVGRFEPRFTEP